MHATGPPQLLPYHSVTHAVLSCAVLCCVLQLAKARIEFAELQKLLAMSVDSKPQQAATVAAAGAGKRQRQH
jgi:hypothetical protein